MEKKSRKNSASEEMIKAKGPEEKKALREFIGKEIALKTVTVEVLPPMPTPRFFVVFPKFASKEAPTGFQILGD